MVRGTNLRLACPFSEDPVLRGAGRLRLFSERCKRVSSGLWIAIPVKIAGLWSALSIMPGGHPRERLCGQMHCLRDEAGVYPYVFCVSHLSFQRSPTLTAISVQPVSPPSRAAPMNRRDSMAATNMGAGSIYGLPLKQVTS